VRPAGQTAETRRTFLKVVAVPENGRGEIERTTCVIYHKTTGMDFFNLTIFITSE